MNPRFKNCHFKVPSTSIGAGSGRGNRFPSFSKGGFLAALALVLAGLAAPFATAAPELGRLFLTPQQRQDLDRRRATNRAEEEAPKIMEGPLTLEGHVQRSGGKTTTWINGTPQYDNRASPDPARVTVVPNEGEPGVSLKVGQTYERANGEIRGLLNGGEITVGKHSTKVVPNKGGPGVSLKTGQTYERTNGKVRRFADDGKITGGKRSTGSELATERGAAAQSPAPAR